MHASHLRAACKTFVDFVHMHEELSKKAFKGNPVNKVARGDITPLGWSSNAFCTFLTSAYRGDIVDKDFPTPKTGLLEIITKYERGEIRMGLQNKFYQFLLSRMMSPWAELISKRLPALGIPHQPPPLWRGFPLALCTGF
jgi:hypothetical protein